MPATANNTYVYNDVNAVAAPGVDDVKFKFIPWGIDQIFQPATTLQDGQCRSDREARARRRRPSYAIDRPDSDLSGHRVQPRDSTDDAETNDRQDGGIASRLRRTRCGIAEIATVRQQLRLAESAGYLCAGLPGKSSVYVLKDDTSECLHASNTEGIPAGTPNPSNYEVYHRPLLDNDDPADLWSFDDLGDGKSITNQAYGRVLHASNTLVTEQGHKYLYTCPAKNDDHAEEFSIVPVDTPDRFTFSGYFKLASVRTGLGAVYGSETTPAGRPRIYQDSDGSTLYFY